MHNIRCTDAPQGRPATARRELLGLLALGWLVSDAGGAEVGTRSLEAQVKAAYLYKFAAHVDWPASAYPDAETPFTIGVVSATEVANELNRLKAGRNVNDRPVEVRVLRPGDTAQGVQLVFLGANDGGQLRRLLEPYKGSPTLTVADVPGAMDAGCAINFVVVDSRLRFEISLGNAERHGLKVSARLLAVAQRVDAGRH